MAPSGKRIHDQIPRIVATESDARRTRVPDSAEYGRQLDEKLIDETRE